MFKTRSTAALSLVVVPALVLAGCGSDGSGGTGGAGGTGGGGETVTFDWERNTAGEDEEPVYETTSVEVPVNPEKVVVFDMASLDTIGSLGGEIAGAPLDSVPDYLDEHLADDAFNAGSLFEADLIEIEAQQPDMIVVAGRSSALWEDLNEIAPTVDLSSQGSFQETLERNLTFLGEVYDAEDEAATALEELNTGIDEVKAVTADVGSGLSIMVSGDGITALKPSNGDYSGRNLRGGLVYDVFGVTPVLDDIEAATHGEPVAFEFLLEHDPDYLFVTDRNTATGSEEGGAAEVVLDNDIVKQTTAYKQDHIIYLDPVAWYVVFGGIQTTQVMIDDMMQVAE